MNKTKKAENFYLEVDLIRKLRKEAKETHRNKSAMLEVILLERYENKEDE